MTKLFILEMPNGELRKENLNIVFTLSGMMANDALRSMFTFCFFKLSIILLLSA